jgi:cyclopropane fatty-acyl-phospholipid synthase-like methyltransferase
MSEDERSNGLPGPRQARSADDFDAMYVAGRPPWDIGRPQSAFRELADRHGLVGRVLDVGCGTGEHALMAAAIGLDATGVDAASTAVTIATRKANERGLTARFMTWNALELGDLGESFDTVVDCGLFHVFEDLDRPRFVDALRASMPVGARYYMLCFSDLEPGDWGPRRIRQDEIRVSFSDGWRVEEIEPAKIETTIEPGSASAWLASILRT